MKNIIYILMLGFIIACGRDPDAPEAALDGHTMVTFNRPAQNQLSLGKNLMDKLISQNMDDLVLTGGVMIHAHSPDYHSQTFYMGATDWVGSYPLPNGTYNFAAYAYAQSPLYAVDTAPMRCGWYSGNPVVLDGTPHSVTIDVSSGECGSNSLPFIDTNSKIFLHSCGDGGPWITWSPTCTGSCTECPTLGSSSSMYVRIMKYKWHTGGGIEFEPAMGKCVNSMVSGVGYPTDGTLALPTGSLDATQNPFKIEVFGKGDLWCGGDTKFWYEFRGGIVNSPLFGADKMKYIKNGNEIHIYLLSL